MSRKTHYLVGGPSSRIVLIWYGRNACSRDTIPLKRHLLVLARDHVTVWNVALWWNW